MTGLSGIRRYIQAGLAEVSLDGFAAINADHEAKALSEKYKFIPTTRVVDVLQGMGWKAVKAQQMTVRNEDRQGYQKHLIRFRQMDAPSIVQKDQVFPEIVLTNSHDGLASFQIMAGLFRVVCSNGLTVADSMFETHRIKHMGYADDQVQEAVESITATVPKIAGRVKDFSDIELTRDEQGVYAMAALTAKYGEDEMQKREFVIDRIISPYRTADKLPSLWNTFNVVQEKLINGGRFAIKKQIKGEREIRKPVKARKVNSITEDIRINRALWMLTEQMAALKGAN